MKKIYFIIAAILSFNLSYSQKWVKVTGITNNADVKIATKGVLNRIAPPDPISPPYPIDPNPVEDIYNYHDTKGEISVSGSGELNYTLPIALPPGIKSVAPQVNLMYGSNSFNGIAGIGWNISGLSSITRIGRNIEKDGEVKGIKFNYCKSSAKSGLIFL